ncbi:MAG: hypothetical protein Q8P18_12030 [Pseudomonadota bacterium]|nr:hypothetical protein [Pseudomonadota bacterium]
MLRWSALAPLFLALSWSAPAVAGPLNPWGAHVGKGVVAVTPFVYVDQTPGVYPLIYGQYGVTERFELLAGVGATVTPGVSFDTVELMPRLFFSDTTAAALHVTYVPGDDGVTLAPEYHGVYSLGPIELTTNVGWGPYVGGSGFSAGSAYAIVAPEWYFTEASSLFLEINPEIDLVDYGGVAVDRFYMELVPGVSTSIAETHYFAVGVGIPVTGFDPTSIYAGMWYSIAFGGE